MGQGKLWLHRRTCAVGFQILRTTMSANDPQAMLAKTKGVQSDIDKLVSGNETLQMYIDNLTMQMAKRRGQ